MVFSVFPCLFIKNLLLGYTLRNGFLLASREAFITEYKGGFNAHSYFFGSAKTFRSYGQRAFNDPHEVTDTFMVVANPSQGAFPSSSQQLLIIGRRMRTLSFQRTSMTGKHMVGRSHLQLVHLHRRPTAARQATEVKILTVQFV